MILDRDDLVCMEYWVSAELRQQVLLCCLQQDLSEKTEILGIVLQDKANMNILEQFGIQEAKGLD